MMRIFRTCRKIRGSLSCSIPILAPMPPKFPRKRKSRNHFMPTPSSADDSTSSPTKRPAVRVVAIGGGTGLSTLLKGLKRYVGSGDKTIPPGYPSIAELCAVVTVSDDGGSSGRLRKELNMPPPGDIRNCIVALSEDEALLSQLFRHRF